MSSAHHVSQSAHLPAQESARDFYAAHGVLEGGYMTTVTAAKFLNKPSAAAFLKWAKRRQVPLVWDGGRWLVLAESIRAELRGRKARR